VIDSLDPTLKDMGTLFGVLRHRLDSQLSNNNIEHSWNIEEPANTIQLTPQKILHIMRIIQEAVTNVIKHSKSTQLIISSEEDINNKDYKIRIVDNGLGFQQKANKNSGRGFSNMAYRAEQASIKLTIDSSTKGTSVDLIFDLNPSSENK
jgi:signal transduction histidine kinase